MKTTAYYLSMLCIALCAISFQQTSVAASSATPLSRSEHPLTRKDLIEAFQKKMGGMVRSIEYGLPIRVRVMVFFAVACTAVGVLVLLFKLTLLCGNSESSGPDWQAWAGAALGGVSFTSLLLIAVRVLLEKSTIRVYDNGMLLPKNCLSRSFFGRVSYFFIPYIGSLLDIILDEQIDSVESLVTQPAIAKQETLDTERQDDKRAAFYRKLVIRLTDGRIYEIMEVYCQGSNAFGVIVEMLKQKGIPVIKNKND